MTQPSFGVWRDLIRNEVLNDQDWKEYMAMLKEEEEDNEPIKPMYRRQFHNAPKKRKTA